MLLAIAVAPVPEGAMASTDWRTHKARKLLERELRNRSIPFENKKMGSKAVYEKYKSCPEFQGMEHDKDFQRRLGSLRKIVKENEEDEGIAWDNSAAKAHLKECFEDGVIPIDYKQGEKPLPAAKRVWDEHCAGHAAFEGMVFNSIFQRRLEGISKNHNSKKARCAEDLKAFKQHRAKCPIRSHNDFGMPRWEGSEAERLMKKDMKEGKHAGLKPEEFRATRPTVFGVIPLPVFRDHIYQELKLWKFHNKCGNGGWED